MSAQRSFIAHPLHTLQQLESTQAAPFSDGMSPSVSKSLRSFPMTRRRQASTPTSRTIALTRIGTKHATGVIVTIIPFPHVGPWGTLHKVYADPQPCGATNDLDAFKAGSVHGYRSMHCDAQVAA